MDKTRKYTALVTGAIIVLFSLFPLQGIQAPEELSILIKNDSVTLGIVPNADDLRTYGTDVLYRDPSGWGSAISLHALTNRNVEDNVQGRYDELEASVFRQWSIAYRPDVSQIIYRIRADVGVVCAGDLALGRIQNLWHTFLFLDHIEVPYEDDGLIRAHPLFGVYQQIVYREDAPWFDQTQLHFGAEFSYRYMPQFSTEWYTSLSIGQVTSSQAQLLFGIGYASVIPMTTWRSHYVVSKHESGLYSYVTGRFGIVAFYYRWHLNSLQGYGGLGFTVGTQQASAWEREDISLSLGFTLPSGPFGTTIRYRITPKLKAFLSNTFTMTLLSHAPSEIRQNTSCWYTGIEYSLPLVITSWMNPFVAIGGGVKRFQIVSYDDVQRKYHDQFCATAAAFAGLRFFPNGELQFNGVSYGWELKGGLSVTDTTTLQKEVFSKELYYTGVLNSWITIAFVISTSL